MRQCKCGGQIRQHQLTNNREAWTCNDCGRYEVIKPEKNEETEWIFEQLLDMRDIN